MANEEVTQLRLKLKAYEATLIQREVELNEYRHRVTQLELKLKAYEDKSAIRSSVEAPTSHTTTIRNGRLQPNSVPSPGTSQCILEVRQSAGAKYIAYDPKASSKGKKRANDSPDERPVKKQAPRWIAAGRRLLDNIEEGKFDLQVARSQEDILPHLDESPYERAKVMAGRASSTLDIATCATSIAQIEMFYSLSALIILEQRKTLSPDQVSDVMDLLEGNSESFLHQRYILGGVKWFHTALIRKLFENGWDIGHAIAVVAKSRFSTP
jgi:hypothetical protein